MFFKNDFIDDKFGLPFNFQVFYSAERCKTNFFHLGVHQIPTIKRTSMLNTELFFFSRQAPAS